MVPIVPMFILLMVFMLLIEVMVFIVFMVFILLIVFIGPMVFIPFIGIVDILFMCTLLLLPKERSIEEDAGVVADIDDVADDMVPIALVLMFVTIPFMYPIEVFIEFIPCCDVVCACDFD